MPARLSRRAAAEPVEERPGSGQSPASRAKDLAAQPALLARIAKKAPIHGGKRVSKATYSFARAAAATSKPPSRRSGARTSKARLEFVRAKYQKGDSVGTYTGAVYMRGVPSYGFNQTYKDKVNAKLLTEELRFNTELKMYTAKVYSPEQAIFVREAAKMVCEADEVPLRPCVARAFERMPAAPVSDARCALACVVRAQKTLVEEAPTDEDIFKIFDFAERKPINIDNVPFTHESNAVIGFGGPTYPFKNDFKAAGFEFRGIVDAAPIQMWVAEADADTADLEEKMAEYGFNLIEYDDVDDADSAAE